MRQHCYRYLMVTLGCVLMGVAINAFYMPNKLISGGIGGHFILSDRPADGYYQSAFEYPSVYRGL